MSIKQNGGVFGRNPTFNDVTIEGQLTFDGDIDINSDLTVDGNLDVTGQVAIGTGSPATTLTVAGSYANGLELDRNGADATSSARLFFDSSSGATAIYNYQGNTLFTTGATAGSASGAEKLRIKSTGDVSVSNGNLVIATSGKGIDFSATSGTGTSELFDDYEEGAWTPVVTGSTSAGTGTYGNQIGLYTKVGRVVHFQCWLQVSAHTGTGVTLINGLPFTSNASDAKGTANLNYFANLTISASNTAGLQVANGQTYLVLKEFPVGGGVAGSVAIDPNMQINFSGSYTV